MVFIQAFRKIHRHYILIIYPILYDLISLAIGLSIVGFYGKEIVSIRLILEMGLPSVSHLSNIPLFVNNIDFLNIQEKIPSYSWMIVVLMILMGAFLQGGYISYLYSIVKGERFRFPQFLSAGKKHWIQFIILEIIIFLGKLSITAFLFLFFNMIGVFASLIFFIVFRIMFIYLEYTIVVDRVSVAAAVKQSREYLKKALIDSLALIIIMYAVSSGISFLLHIYWSPFTIIGLIVVYAYLMSVIQIAFMSVLGKIKANGRY